MKKVPRFKVLLKSKGKGGHIDRQKQTPWSWTRRGNCTKHYGSVKARREQFYLWGLVKVSFHWEDIWTEFWWICAFWSQKEERVTQALIINLPSSQGDKLIHTRESGSSISYSLPVEVLSLYFAILIIICNLSENYTETMIKIILDFSSSWFILMHTYDHRFREVYTLWFQNHNEEPIGSFWYKDNIHYLYKKLR